MEENIIDLQFRRVRKYKWLYYVYLPSIMRWKVGVAYSIYERMNTLGLKSLYGRDFVSEGTDYVVLFKRKYTTATALKYEQAIHKQSTQYRVPSSEKPLRSGNTELYWMDIGSTFIPYIPASDIPVKEPKKVKVKEINIYAGSGYVYNKKLNKYYLRMVNTEGNRISGAFKVEHKAKEKVKLYLGMGYKITN